MHVCKSEKWSNKTVGVVPLYLVVKGIPRRVGTPPGVGLKSWSIDPTSPRRVATFSCFRVLGPLYLQGFLCALP